MKYLLEISLRKLIFQIIQQHIHMFTFTFTFMHLADAFIQSDLQCIQAIHVLSLCVYSYLMSVNGDIGMQVSK